MAARATGNRGFCLGCALAILTAVMASPLRPADSKTRSAPNYLRRNFAIPTTGSKFISAGSVRWRPASVKAIRAEGEEEEKPTRHVLPIWAGFAVSSMNRVIPHAPDRGDSGPMQASRPLRC